MKLSKRQLRRMIRKSMVETYDGEGRPNWDNEEKLRKAGKFDKSNISKADEEQTAAELKYREDLRKDYERKLAEIEKMKQDRNARKKGERYRFDENKENTKMKLSKRQLKRIIREAIGTGLDGSVSLDHVINCYIKGMTDEECADSMPNGVDIEELQDFANFVLRASNTYRDQGEY